MYFVAISLRRLLGGESNVQSAWPLATAFSATPPASAMRGMLVRS